LPDGKLVPMPRPRPGAQHANRDEADQPEAATAAPRRPTIVIDPGHGGIDPGAISRSGTSEKDVVLAFAKTLKEELETSGRYRVLMTRTEDVFLSLRDRVRVARSNSADLLVVIHADSLRSAKARGATVYTVSEKASDAEAEALAHNENRADVIAGVDLAAENGEITDILIDLAQRETKNYSVSFAKTLVKELKPVARLNSRPIRSAGFRVLKAPDVPSVLLELGYLSNRSDENLLLSQKWRGKVAGAVTAAIERYFGTHLASGN
jgi:N-acetylmuramoyl-L-alanine amidase